MAGAGRAVRGPLQGQLARFGVPLMLLFLAMAGAMEPSAAQASPPEDPDSSDGGATTGNRTTGCDANTTCAQRTPYRFELVNETLDQNLTIRDADAVVVRNSRVFGDLVVEVVDRLVLEDVFLAGSLRVRDARNVTLTGLIVLGHVDLEKVGPLVFTSSQIGRDLRCRICADGRMADILAGGALAFEDDWNVTRSNVRSSAVQLSMPAAPTPEPGQVRLGVANESLAFTHERAIERTVGEAVGRIEVRLDVDPDAARAQLRLSNETGPTADAPRVDTGFEKLFEFEDMNGDGSFDLGDRVLREIRIPDLRPRAVQQQRLTKDLMGWQSRLEFNVGGAGVLALVFTTQDASSDQTKIDVEMLRFPYSSPTSRLAFQVRLASAHEWTYVPGDLEDQIRFPGAEVDGYFSWVRTALVDRENATVRAKLLEERNDLGERTSVVLLMSYDRGDVIRHDPTLGVTAASLLEGGPLALGDRLVYGAALGSALVLLWTLGRTGRRAKP